MSQQAKQPLSGSSQFLIWTEEGPGREWIVAFDWERGGGETAISFWCNQQTEQAIEAFVADCLDSLLALNKRDAMMLLEDMARDFLAGLAPHREVKKKEG